jgi:spore coat protein U-like protein
VAFDFPDNPVVGDEFQSGGATYTYTAQGVWDLGSSAVATDYVLKAGDTMTGDLIVAGDNSVNIRGAASGVLGQGLIFQKDDGAKNAAAFRTKWNAGPGSSIEATLECWTMNGGYDWQRAFSTTVGSPPGVSFNGAVTISGDIVSNNGISFGAVVDANADDFAKHIELYSGTNGMGIGATSGGQFNLVLKNLGHAFNFRLGGATKVQINQYGIMMQENAGLIDFGSLNTNASPSANNKGIRFFYSTGAAYHIGVSNNQLNYVISVGSTRHSFWQGGAERFYVDSTGGHGAALTAERFLDKSLDRVAKLKADKELAAFVRPDEGDTSEGEGYDIGALLMLALAKIKALEGEVTALKRGKR